MARSDLLVNLVKAGSRGDQAQFRRTVEAIAAEERAKNHNVLAERLTELLSHGNGLNGIRGPHTADDQVQSLLSELIPRRSVRDLILPSEVLTCFDELVEEQQRCELLRSYNLEPRHRVLLVGPPGNGKTSLAEALAEALMVPLFVVRYEGVIGSYLGETALRLRKLFDFIRTRQCVLFLDEFDTIGKERGDVHETGEIKRVVSSLLLQVDDLPSHVVVVTATNHPELLDRAVWRRFQLRLSLPNPGVEHINEWLQRYQESLGQPLGISLRELAKKLAGLSFAEVEDFGTDIARRRVLADPSGDVKRIVQDRLKQLRARYSLPESNSECYSSL